MIDDKHIVKLVDYPISTECFPSVEIKGGICYFLWDKDTEKDCQFTSFYRHPAKTMVRPLRIKGASSIIRFSEGISIFLKVISHTEIYFDSMVSSRKPFGLGTEEKGHIENRDGDILFYGNKAHNYISKTEIKNNPKWIDTHKVYISYAYGAGEGYPHQIINIPFLGEKGSACSETYLVIGPFGRKEEAINAISYIKTKFFRFMVMLVKYTQHATQNVYRHVPIQDFSRSWTDNQLYEKYELSEDEILFIESMVKNM